MNPDPVVPESARPRRNPVVMVVGGIGGLIAIYLGIRQIMGGVREMGGDDRVNGVLAEVNKIVDEANAQTTEAAPILQGILQGVDDQGLAVRQARAADGQKVSDLLSKAAAAYRNAAAKLSDASELGVVDAAKGYFKAKAEAYRQIAITKDGGREMVQIVFDPAITDKDTVVRRIKDVAARVDQANAASQQAADTAAAIQKQHPDIIR